MKSSTWLFMLAVTLLLAMALVAACNVLVDPFGQFGDPVFGWNSYNFTNNPRAAKIAYLDRYAARYDSYLFGASTTSSYPVGSVTTAASA